MTRILIYTISIAILVPFLEASYLASQKAKLGTPTYVYYKNLLRTNPYCPSVNELASEENYLVDADENGVPLSVIIDGENVYDPEDFQLYSSTHCQAPYTICCIVRVRYMDGVNPTIMSIIYGYYNSES